MAYLVEIKTDIFTIVTEVRVVYIVDFIGWRTIRDFAFLMATMTKAASTFSITLKMTSKILLTMSIFVFAITARVVIVLSSSDNQLFLTISLRFVLMNKRLIFLDRQFCSSKCHKKCRPVFCKSEIQIQSYSDLGFQFLSHMMNKKILT